MIFMSVLSRARPEHREEGDFGNCCSGQLGMPSVNLLGIYSQGRSLSWTRTLPDATELGWQNLTDPVSCRRTAGKTAGKMESHNAARTMGRTTAKVILVISEARRTFLGGYEWRVHHRGDDAVQNNCQISAQPTLCDDNYPT